MKAQINSHEVLLNYPVSNLVEVVVGEPATISLREPAVPGDETSGDPEAAIPFNAWSASGDVTGELVYVNYGHAEVSYFSEDINEIEPILLVFLPLLYWTIWCVP